MKADPELTVRDVSKSYWRKHALQSVSFRRSGFGVTYLLGLNGAGKSTLLRILAGMETPNTGDVELSGHALSPSGWGKANAGIGFLAQGVGLPTWMRCNEFVSYCAWLKGMDPQLATAAANQALAEVDLSDRRDSRIPALSGGMQMRLALAATVVHGPSLILLDEPTSFLDPVQAHLAHQLIVKLSSEARVVVSSHAIEFIPPGGDLIVLSDGQLAFDGSATDFVSEEGGASFTERLRAALGAT